MGCIECKGLKNCRKPKKYMNLEYSKDSAKLPAFDWMHDISLPNETKPFDLVEIRFKNSRKDFYRNVNNLELSIGDIVAVEASPGHDIGVVSLSGELVRTQIKYKNYNTNPDEVKKIYRKAKSTDIEKWYASKDLEWSTMIKSRELAMKFHLSMKISDVEYQGDGTKATFFYTAEDRVDFRELIRSLADAFKVRIEMRQIGVRQEASRVGGIGSCGRELCCTKWLTDFKSVSTNTARCQQLSLNPPKLAGQCAKLKCCLNYEYDTYMDATKDYPDPYITLKSKNGDAVHQKTDIFKRIMYYSYTNAMDTFHALPVDRVKEIIELNKKKIFPDKIELDVEPKLIKKLDFENGVGQDSLTRFDNKSKNQNSQRPEKYGNQTYLKKNSNPPQIQKEKIKTPIILKEKPKT